VSASSRRGHTPTSLKAHNAEQILAHLVEASSPTRSADLASAMGLSLKCVQTHLRALHVAGKVRKTLDPLNSGGGHPVRWEAIKTPNPKQRRS